MIFPQTGQQNWPGATMNCLKSRKELRASEEGSSEGVKGVKSRKEFRASEEGSSEGVKSSVPASSGEGGRRQATFPEFLHT